MRKTDFVKNLDKLYPLLSSYELISGAKKFKHELIAALHNQQSSLPTILNPIYKFSPSRGFGVAVSIGGTNGYVSAFQVSPKGIVKFLNRETFVLPTYTTKNKLFHLITKYVLSVVANRGEAFKIGIGFAYNLNPTMIDKYIDGELTSMSKGRSIEGLVGKKIGQEYHKFLIKNYNIDTCVTVANDAICLLLGGDGAEIAGVVGTGLNFAYWENRTHIAPLKLIQLHRFVQSEIAVNVESANFDKLAITPLGIIVDRGSEDPGFSLAEKETAGAYLYQIFNVGKDKLIGKDFPDLTSTDQLNDIITGAYEQFRIQNSEVSIQNAKLFAERIFHRSAQIVAVELCGIFMKIGKTKGIVPVVMEGGIFWKAKNYTTLVNLYVNMILPEVIPSFARLFGSSRRGIAILARGT